MFGVTRRGVTEARDAVSSAVSGKMHEPKLGFCRLGDTAVSRKMRHNLYFMNFFLVFDLLKMLENTCLTSHETIEKRRGFVVVSVEFHLSIRYFVARRKSNEGVRSISSAMP